MEKDIRIIYINPFTEKKETIILSGRSENGKKSQREIFVETYNTTKNNDPIIIPLKGKFISTKRGTTFYEEIIPGDKDKVFERKIDQIEKTRFDIQPPTTQEYRCLMLGLLAYYPNAIWSQIPGTFKGTIKSIWNWNNEKTKEILEIGNDLVSQGYTPASFFEKLKPNA